MDPKFYLYRTMVYPARDTPLLSSLNRDETPSSVLRKLIHPDGVRFRSQSWFIGNVEAIDENGVCFKFGRTTNKNLSILDERGDFDQTLIEAAPHCDVVLDYRLEVGAISLNRDLSPTTESVARKLAKFLSTTQIARNLLVEIEILPIKDPNSFLTHLRSAFAVTQFWITTHRPNPFDDDALIAKPVAKALEKAGGDKARVDLRGKSLNVDVVNSVATAIAASGGDAGAKIRRRKGERPTTVRMKSGPASQSGSVANEAERIGFLEKIRDAYQKIRGIGDADAKRNTT